jgi:hypothetical protein
MRHRILRITAVILLLAMSMLYLSCTETKCMAEKQKCKFDCPSTVGLKQACEEKCNILYDICRNKK